MADKQNEEWVTNRTFVLPDSPSVSTRIVIRPIDLGNKFRSGPPPSMGVPDPELAKPGTQRAYSGFRWVAGHLTPVTVREWDGQRFTDFATPWEKVWSVLCQGKLNTLSPVVFDTGEVMGYFGRVNSNNVVPFPSYAKDGSIQETWFVLSSLTIRIIGATSRGFSDTSLEVITTTDGEVLNVGGAVTRGVEAEDVSPVDLIMGVKMLVDLGAGLGAKLLTVLQRRSADKAARAVAAGVTRKMVEAAAKKGPLRFEVLAEGPPIPGTNVPEWVHIKVGNSEFLVGRNANAVNKLGEAMGPATKHLAEKVRDVNGPWKPWSRDYPMSSLAGGLEEAERRIKNHLAPLHNSEPGVFKVVITEKGQSGWDFTIDTKQTPWRVFHVVITK